MLRGIKEVQLFLLSNPDKERTLTEPNIISYALIKLTKTGGMYAKGIDKWKNQPPQDHQKWSELLAHTIEGYERQLTETGGTTMGQEGCGTEMHATEYFTDGYSLTEKFTKYAERSTQTEENMAQMEAKLEEKLSMMTMQQLPQQAYLQQPPPHAS